VRTIRRKLLKFEVHSWFVTEDGATEVIFKDGCALAGESPLIVSRLWHGQTVWCEVEDNRSDESRALVTSTMRIVVVEAHPVPKLLPQFTGDDEGEVVDGEVVREAAPSIFWEQWWDTPRMMTVFRLGVTDNWYHHATREQMDRLNALASAMADLVRESGGRPRAL
jgi:hypothetical protein